MEDRIPGGLQYYYKMCCKKDSCCRRQACNLEIISPWRCNFWMGGLIYNSISFLRTESLKSY